jgi:hypothetical protein
MTFKVPLTQAILLQHVQLLQYCKVSCLLTGIVLEDTYSVYDTLSIGNLLPVFWSNSLLPSSLIKEE